MKQIAWTDDYRLAEVTGLDFMDQNAVWTLSICFFHRGHFWESFNETN